MNFFSTAHILDVGFLLRNRKSNALFKILSTCSMTPSATDCHSIHRQQLRSATSIDMFRAESAHEMDRPSTFSFPLFTLAGICSFFLSFFLSFCLSFFCVSLEAICSVLFLDTPGLAICLCSRSRVPPCSFYPCTPRDD